MEAGHRCLFSYGESCSDLGAVYRDVLYRVCSAGREGDVSPGVSVVDVVDRVHDGDHQDVYRESSFLPRVCCFRAGLDVPLLEHA